jgi:MFS transporter, FSR family, fosmidomycin resistance protein
MSPTKKYRSVRAVLGFTILLLMIELLDELVDGVRGAAWPLIRQDLHLSYMQVGLVLTVPNAIASLIEPVLGIWGDTGYRRQLILAGGLGFAIALFLISISQDVNFFLAGFVLLAPASGSFVNLSQATLMDLQPTRHQQNMARWALAGSLGNVLGPLILAGTLLLRGDAWYHGWRGAFFVLAALTAVLLVLLCKAPIALAPPSLAETSNADFKTSVGNAIAALQRSTVRRWLILLQVSDLMLDVLRGFVALYFVDVVGTTAAQASMAIAIWLGLGLLGDFLLIPLLEQVCGLTYLKVSAGLVLCLYPAFLGMPNVMIKLVLLGCLGFLNAGWYAILQGQLYTAMPGQSGAVMTLSNVFGFVGGFAPLILSWVAQQIGLEPAMWILLLSPIALLVGLLRSSPES